MIRFALWFWSIFLLAQFVPGCSLVDKEWMKEQQRLAHEEDMHIREENLRFLKEHDQNMTKQHQAMMPERAAEVGVLGAAAAAKIDAIKADADAKIAATQKKLDDMATDDQVIKWLLGAAGTIAGMFGISKYVPSKGSSEAIAALSAKVNGKTG